jgi:hypothetical protein
LLSTEQRNALIRETLLQYNPDVSDFSHDRHDNLIPVGHLSGMATASEITSDFRKQHRPKSMNITSQQVIETLQAAKLDHWVLMGLYGYVGYLAQPRATQDVDILVSELQLEQAIRAISKRWPKLVVERTPVVTRFLDTGDIAIDHQMKQVIDLMRPTDAFYQTILECEHRIEHPATHRIPTLEGAIVAKYSAIISPYRVWERKQQDAVDLRNIILPNVPRINRQRLQQLGELVYPGGGAELLEFLQLAIDHKPFPV